MTIIPTVRKVHLVQGDDGQFTWNYVDDGAVYLGPFATVVEAKAGLFTPVVVEVVEEEVKK